MAQPLRSINRNVLTTNVEATDAVVLLEDRCSGVKSVGFRLPDGQEAVATLQFPGGAVIVTKNPTTLVFLFRGMDFARCLLLHEMDWTQLAGEGNNKVAFWWKQTEEPSIEISWSVGDDNEMAFEITTYCPFLSGTDGKQETEDPGDAKHEEAREEDKDTVAAAEAALRSRIADPTLLKWSDLPHSPLWMQSTVLEELDAVAARSVLCASFIPGDVPLELIIAGWHFLRFLEMDVLYFALLSCNAKEAASGE